MSSRLKQAVKRKAWGAPVAHVIRGGMVGLIGWAASSGAAHAANPVDNGTPGYVQVYVDSTSSCVLPATCGSQSNPYRNLREAFSMVRPGTELIIAGRPDRPYYSRVDGETSTFALQQFLRLPLLEQGGSPEATGPDQAPTLIRGWRGMDRPVVRGTMMVSAWQPVPGQPRLYSLNWNTVGEGLHQGGGVFPLVGPQQLYRGTTSLQQLGGLLYGRSSYDSDMQYQWPMRTAERSIGRIDPGTSSQPWLNLGDDQFYFHHEREIKKATLYARFSTPLQPGEVLEASVQQFVLQTGRIHNVTIRDLVFERSNGSAYSPQNSAITIGGRNVVLDGIVAQDMDAICIYLSGTNLTLKNSVLRRCGQMGLAASGTGHLVSANEIVHNNAKGFNEWWAAAGIKLVGGNGLSDSTFSHNVVAYNQGHGVWLDSDPRRITVANNTVAFNGLRRVGGIGVFVEISNDNRVIGNQIFGNQNQGIQLKGLGNVVTGNLIAGNRGPGIAQPADTRLVVPQPLPDSSLNVIERNRFAWNDEILIVNPSDNHRAALALLGFVRVDHNQYCGAGPIWGLGTNVSYSFSAWRSNSGFDTSPLASSVTVTPYPYDGSTSALLGNRFVNRDATLIDEARAGALLGTVSASCGWQGASAVVGLTVAGAAGDQGPEWHLTAELVDPTGQGSVPSGRVQFMDGATALGEPVNVVDGRAVLMVPAGDGTAHHFTAVYLGDGTHSGASSPEVLAGGAEGDVPALPAWGAMLLGPLLLGAARRHRQAQVA